jgi:YHS domain-containing protein
LLAFTGDNEIEKGNDAMNTNSRLTSRTAIIAYGAAVAVVAAIIGAFFIAPMLESNHQFAKYNIDNANVAIHGYDTVAYFTDGKPTKGKGEFEHVWEDARWKFASATNLELFKANPERYAPQFGGYCAGGLTVGEYADGDPKIWSIVDGKLYFIANEKYQTVWNTAPETAIHFGEYNWINYRDKLRNNM